MQSGEYKKMQTIQKSILKKSTTQMELHLTFLSVHTLLNLSVHTYRCVFSNFYRNELTCISCSVTFPPLVNYIVNIFPSMILAVQTFVMTVPPFVL